MNLKRCINCLHRDLWDAGSRCNVSGDYISDCNVWDYRCKHWRKDTRKLGEIGVYVEERPGEAFDDHKPGKRKEG